MRAETESEMVGGSGGGDGVGGPPMVVGVASWAYRGKARCFLHETPVIVECYE